MRTILLTLALVVNGCGSGTANYDEDIRVSVGTEEYKAKDIVGAEIRYLKSSIDIGSAADGSACLYTIVDYTNYKSNAYVVVTLEDGEKLMTPLYEDDAYSLLGVSQNENASNSLTFPTSNQAASSVEDFYIFKSKQLDDDILSNLVKYSSRLRFQGATELKEYCVAASGNSSLAFAEKLAKGESATIYLRNVVKLGYKCSDLSFQAVAGGEDSVAGASVTVKDSGVRFYSLDDIPIYAGNDDFYTDQWLVTLGDKWGAYYDAASYAYRSNDNKYNSMILSSYCKEE